MQQLIHLIRRNGYLGLIIILFPGCTTFHKTSKAVSYNPERLSRITDVQKEFVDSELLGSNRVMIYKDGKFIYDKTVNSNREGDAVITDKTIFPIWSMTKPITAVAAMILYERGKIMLHDPIKRYLPEMDSLKCLDSNGNVYLCKKNVTIYQLLTHEAGWSYYPTKPKGKYVLVTDTIYKDLKDFSVKMSDTPLKFEPGSSYEYGINTALLGRIIEVISGQSLQQFMKENIFVPLEMTDTKFEMSAEERKRFQPLYHYDGNPKGKYTYEYDELSYKEGTKVQLGGEGLVSSASDYSHFCEMLLNNGIYKGKRILSPATIELMKQPMVAERNNGAMGAGFSYGFNLYNLTNPVADGGLSPAGIFGWGGYHSTFFWIDQKNNLYGLIMTRRTPTYFTFFRKIRIAVYQAMN